MDFGFTECPHADIMVFDGLKADSKQYHQRYKHFKLRTGAIRKDAALKAGFKHKYWRIGCGKCEICLTERKKRKAERWRLRLMAVLSSPEYDVWSWGKKKHLKFDRGYFMTVTVRNAKYPGLAYTLSDDDLGFFNRTCHAFREWTYFCMLARIQDMWKLLRGSKYCYSSCMGGTDFHYIVFFEFGTKNTNRIHAHIFILSPDRNISLAICKAFKLEYNKRYGTTDEHGVRHTMVGSNKRIVNYATKYSTKCLSEHRINCSQFNFDSAVSHYLADRYESDLSTEPVITPAGKYAEKYIGGFKKWHVVVEKEKFSDLLKNMSISQAIERYVESSSVLGVVELDKPSLNPYKGGYFKCCWDKRGISLTQLIEELQLYQLGYSIRMNPMQPQMTTLQLRTKEALAALMPNKGEQFVSLCVEDFGLGPLCRDTLRL